MSEHIVKKAEGFLENIPLHVITQGAEAVIFSTETHPYIDRPYLKNREKYIVKYRPSKPYRHPKIDASITKSRTSGEVKLMNRLRKLGIRAPALILADYIHGIIWMEYVGEKLPDGEISSFKNYLWYLEREELDCVSKEVMNTCIKVGWMMGQLHFNDLVHGDFTTSNIILQEGEPVVIDFGLSSQSGLVEDKAVDIYLLERAVNSTHSVYADQYNKWLLQGYKSFFTEAMSNKNGQQKWREIMKRLDEVRLRGRKRSMIG